MSKVDKWWMGTPVPLKIIIVMGLFMFFVYTSISFDLVPPPPEVNSSIAP